MVLAGRRWRVRTVLVGLVLASLLPGLLAAGYLLVRAYRNDLAERKNDNVAAARLLVQAVDAQLDKAHVLGRILAAEDETLRGDLPAVHARARELLALAGVGRNVVLTDRSGQQVLNTLRDYGQPLPRHGNLDIVRRVFEKGETVVSDLYVGGLGRPVLSIDMPVTVGGRVVYDLSVGLLPADFDPVMATAGFSSDRMLVIFDSTGTIVARSQAPERFVGRKGTAEFIERIRETGEGAMVTRTLEGIEVVSAYSSSRATGWSAGVGVPLEVLHAGVKTTLGLLAMFFAMFLVAGLALAAAAAALIARAMRSLVGPATALGAGGDAAVPGTAIREADEVGHAIGEAAKLLATRTRALEEANTALRAREGELRDAQHIARLGTWDWSRARGDVQVSEEVRAMFGGGQCTFAGMRGTALPVDDWERADEAVRRAASTGQGFEIQLAVNALAGERMWADVTGRAVLDAHGEVAAVIGTVQDVTERKRAQDALRAGEARFREQLERQVAERTAQLTRANQALERAVRHDVLTGLDNRLSANERLRAEFKRMQRGGAPYALLLLDIDRFKSVNDHFGHGAGDEVLRHLAMKLREGLRETDFAARFGGEEFVVLLPQTSEDGAIEVAEKLRAEIAAAPFPGPGRVTVSIGVSCARPDDASESDVVFRADKALYCAKGEGRNAVRRAA
ncbi:MAG TPA: diguanylate cyclase [Usitatibacter sp.]|nr:diguanylate cyclase [Usitatibacter sp.]